MEENITQFSHQPILKTKKPRDKKKIAITVSAVVIALSAGVGIYKYHRHQKWLAYMDKYYYPFIEKHGLSDYEQGDVSVESEMEYEYKGDNILFFLKKPMKDHFNFRVRLMANPVSDTNACFDVSFDDYVYDFNAEAQVDENGEWNYYVSSNYYPEGSSYSSGGMGFYLLEDGKYKESEYKSGKLTANDRKVIDDIQPQLKELYDELRYVLLDGIAEG
jgi:hypothetical protein